MNDTRKVSPRGGRLSGVGIVVSTYREKHLANSCANCARVILLAFGMGYSFAGNPGQVIMNWPAASFASNASDAPSSSACENASDPTNSFCRGTSSAHEYKMQSGSSFSLPRELSATRIGSLMRRAVRCSGELLLDGVHEEMLDAEEDAED